MKRLTMLILLFCFSVVMFADVGKSPPVEKQGIEITLTTYFEAFEMQSINPVVTEGVYFIAGSAMVTCITSTIDVNSKMIEWFIIDLRLEANKSNDVFRQILEEGSGGDYSIHNSIDCYTNYPNGALYEKSLRYDFDYSSNKLLKQSWQSDTLRNNNRFINA